MQTGRQVQVRWVLFVALLAGLAGTATDLVLTEHYEDVWQLVPIVLTALAVVLLLAHVTARSTVTRWLFRGTMALFIVGGLLGIVLHARGSAEFQLEVDPQMDRWTLVTKVARAKAPPALAPGLMIQLGLLGLAFTLVKERSL